jgi:hypothetical protein
VDALIAQGDVHVIRSNRPEYVVLTEAEEAHVVRVKASAEDVKAGRGRRFAFADERLQSLDSDGE